MASTSRYEASIAPDQGFHPVVSLSIHLDPNELDERSADECSLWTHLDLPPSFIVDRFQLTQLHREGRLGSYDAVMTGAEATFRVVGEQDLEGPVTRAEGAQVLLRLKDSKGKSKESDLEVELPLHLRYQTPVPRRFVEGKRADVVPVELPWPSVFWKCPPSNKAIRRCPPAPSFSAFSSADSTSSFHYLPPTNTTRPWFSSACSVPLLPSIALQVPTGVSTDLQFVDAINFGAIWLGTIWIGWSAFKAQQRRRDGIASKGVKKKQ